MTLNRPLPKEVVHTEAGYFAKIQHSTAQFDFDWIEIEPEAFEDYIKAGVTLVKLNTQNQ